MGVGQLEGNFLASHQTNFAPFLNLHECLADRLKLVCVPDETTRAIDRFFDVVDNSVAAVDRVLNRSKYTEEQLKEQGRRHKRREVIDAESTTSAKPKAKSSSTAVARKPHFYIVESIDPKSGNTLYVVTDGGQARTECGTREFATQILRALEKASP